MAAVHAALPKPVVFSTSGIQYSTESGEPIAVLNRATGPALLLSSAANSLAASPRASPAPGNAVPPAKNGPIFSSKSRKSKSEALTKLAAVDVDEISGKPTKPKPVAPPPPPVDLPVPKNNPARQFLARPRAKPLGFEDICVQAPRTLPTRSAGRLFGIGHCPVFYPTEEEFAKPLQYIESLMEQSFEHYGIVKVVPPQDWKPTFSLNTETFRFKTRVQRLNSMEASARSSLTFLEQLAVFHRQQKGPKATIPIIDGQTVDLWRLRKNVNELGGYRAVSSARRWPAIARMIGFDPKTSPAVTAIIKQAYAKIIVPFEHYLDRVQMTNITPLPGLSPPKSDAPSMHAMSSRMSGGTSSAAITHDVVTHQQVQEASDKLNEALEKAGQDDSAEANLTSPINTKHLLKPGEVCEICHRDHDHRHIILCDECDRGYHMSCLTPPLTRVPNGDWVCDGCVVSTGADFGFEIGQEHTLLSYSKKADEFKRLWLESHPIGGPQRPDPLVDGTEAMQTDTVGPAPTIQSAQSPLPCLSDSRPQDFSRHLEQEAHVESEFWRLVESQTETVEVEYGADLHSSKYGSGFPSLERDALDPYARDGWNLTNLPLLTGSLLRYIKSDIAGMTNPWLYAGMCFSTFAWHKEDHYTYSINYHHFGETKTWYGVPADDDQKLEAAVKKAAPELFAAQPDLMFQLVTLLSPLSLLKEGVRVSACDQRAGEFVITFPKSYHAGFNHGFNVCEAVNFSLPDWLEHGLACVEHYRELGKLPVFSHDELVCNIFLYEKNAKTSRWLLPYFKVMIEREMKTRKNFRDANPDLTQVVQDAILTDDQSQCVKCRCYCYLSQVFPTASPSRATCQEHAQAVFGNVKLTMRLRYSDTDLLIFLKRIKARAEKPNAAPVPEEPAEARKSSRQRIPTAAALEAMGQDALPFGDRRKRSSRDPSLTPAKRARYSDASMADVSAMDYTIGESSMADMSMMMPDLPAPMPALPMAQQPDLASGSDASSDGDDDDDDV